VGAEKYTREDITGLADLARSGLAAQLDTILARQREIVALDFEALQKISMLMPKAANNGICGLGCAAAERVAERGR